LWTKQFKSFLSQFLCVFGYNNDNNNKTQNKSVLHIIIIVVSPLANKF